MKNNPEHNGEEEYNFYGGAFPDDQQKIFDYNCVVRDLNGRSQDDFRRRESFEISSLDQPHRPEKRECFRCILAEIGI